MNRRMIKVSLLAGAAFGFGTATDALAQSSNSAPVDIIVTARRIEERLQDVPISITVFNQQQLTSHNITQGTDLANFTPSLSTNTGTFGSQNSTYSIRGFYQDPGTQPSVGVYFADVVAPRGAANNLPIGDGAGPGDFFDLQNVQVLKGPQGTLEGRNTTGGAILLVPQKPTSKFGGYVEGSYGNHNMKRIQAVLNLPLSEIARFRIGVDHQDRDGYVHNDTGIGPKDFNDIGYTAVRASLVVDLTPDLENYTIATYTRSDTNGDITKVTDASPTSFTGILASAQLARELGTGFYTAQNTEPNPRTLLTTWRVINTTTWHASDTLTIKNIASYAELRESFLSALFGTDLDLHDVVPFFPVGSNILFAESAPLANANTAAQATATDEVQIQGSAMDNKLTYQFGGYAEMSDPLGTTGSQSPLFDNCADAATFTFANPIGAASINYTAAQTHTRNYGLYAQGTYSITSKLKLTAGFRYTWDSEKDFNYLRGYQFALNPAQATSIGYTCNDGVRFGTALHPMDDVNGCRATLEEKAHKPTWLLDLDYKPTDDILIYAKWARGFRAGGLVPQAPSGINTAGVQVGSNYQTYAPEKVDDYEIGLKSQFRGPIPVTFNVNGFYNNFSNQQLLSSLLPDTAAGSNAGVASGIINAGKSRIYGVEVEASISPFKGFSLDGSYTYLHARLRQVNGVSGCDGTYCVAFPALAGDPLPLAPDHKFVITGTYVLPLDASVGKVSFSATESYRSRYLTNYLNKNTPGLPAFVKALSYEKGVALLSLNANWTSIMGSRFDLSVFGTNVLGKHYFTAESGLFTATQFETQSYGEPRMFGARIKYHFGS